MSTPNQPLPNPHLDALLAETGWVLKLAKRLARDQAAAEDIAQSALTLALEKRPHAEEGLRPWLAMVVGRLARRRVRSETRRQAREAVALSASSSETAASDEVLIRFELQQDLSRRVDALPELYRRVLIYHYYEGLSVREISSATGATPSTVRTQLARGLERIRLQYNREPNGHDGHGALGLFLIAAGSGSDFVSRRTLEVFLMQTSTKTLAATAVAIAVGVMAFDFVRPDTLRLDREATPVVRDAQHNALASEEQVPESGSPVTTLREEISGDASPAANVAAAEHERGSLRVQVLRGTGAPAQGVHMTVTLARASAHLRQQFRRRSDSMGMVNFEDLPAGTVELSSDRGSSSDLGPLAIPVGETLELTFVIPKGVHVYGMVHDENRRPVPNAGVWLTADSERWTGGALVTNTDAGGRFEILDAPKSQSIGAVAAGFQPSALLDLDTVETTGGSTTIEIALASGGAQLRGVVRDAIGQPLSDALVAVGDASGTGWRRSDGTNYEVWTARTTRTDTEGVYLITGLKPGEHPVQVRHHGYALWSDSVELDGRGRHTLDMTLARGIKVRGTVTTVEGEPIAGASVLAFHQPLAETYLQGGRIEYRGAFNGPAALTDEAGAYELHEVAPGAMSLYAFAPRRTPNSEYEDSQYAVAHLDITKGADTLWNPVLADGKVIEGRTLYRDGAAITGVYVGLESTDGTPERLAHSTDGHFRFLNLGDGPYTLRVNDWRRPDGATQPTVEAVYPDRGPIDVVAAYDAPQSLAASVVGVRMIVDPAGWAAGWSEDAKVVLESALDHRWYGGTRVANEWTFQLREPGAYRAVALIGARRICTGPYVQVQEADEINLPDLVPGPSGTLVILIDRPEDAVASGVRAFLRQRPTKRAESFEVGGRAELRIEHLEPGPGRITFTGENISDVDLEFEVMAGGETQQSVQLLAAVPVVAQVHWPPGESSGTMTLKYVDRTSGEVTYEVHLDDLTDYSSPMPWTGRLPIGLYTLEVTKNGRPHYSEDFEVTSLEPGLAPTPGSDR